MVRVWGQDSSSVTVPEDGPRLFLWGENHEPFNVWEERELGENGDRLASERADASEAGMLFDSTEGTANGRSRNSLSRGKIPSHPAQMPVGTLRQILRQLATASELTSLLGSPATASVWLPSQGDRPQTHLGSFQKGVNALSGVNEPFRLQPWQVTGLTLDPFHTLAFLSRFTNQRLIELPSSASLFRHARLGNDLLFWSHAAKFVLELLAGQHFLPGLIPDNSGRFWAAWQPFLLEGSLRERLEYLVALMPPICRAYELESLDDAPASGAIVEHFISVLMNRAIREWAPGAAGSNGEGGFWDSSDSFHRVQGSGLPTSGSLWLEGLSGEEPLLQLPPQPAHQLYKRWIEWMEQLHSSVADSNFQVAFALELQSDDEEFLDEETEPADSSPAPISLANWHLQYFLQDKDDPEILIPAQRVWNQNGQSIRVEGRRFDQPQERLLTGLGVASRLFPPIRDSLRAPRPERATLSSGRDVLVSEGDWSFTPEQWIRCHHAGMVGCSQPYAARTAPSPRQPRAFDPGRGGPG